MVRPVVCDWPHEFMGSREGDFVIVRANKKVLSPGNQREREREREEI